jgi:hypothetical protein
MGILATGTLQTVGDVQAVRVEGHSHVVFTLTGVPVGASVAFETTTDGHTWAATTAAGPAGTVVAASSAGDYTVVAGSAILGVRVRLTAITSGSFHVLANGQVPVAGSTPAVGGSGPTHAGGDVPDPGPVAGTTRFLREDATWAIPPGGGAAVNVAAATTVTTQAALAVNATAGAVAVTLPPVASAAGPVRIFKSDSSANAVTIAPSSGTINGGASVSITTQYGKLTCWPFPSGWLAG